ncbi:hypothetical protein [Pseudomonas orientalis]|uniref:Uncharacterized protein n=1 Tax=Pseudomonas orientalis TaxID=76758 RepID=A0A4Q7CVN0_9PSED|nr:hypothetical protein [Pseudomonas orientalis]RZI29458.1 hypothetical protein EUX57_22865 [Pseudomonas orientalis]
MQMHEAKQVAQVIGALNANAKLAEGWTLLAVVSGEVVKSETPSAVYVLGKAEAEVKEEDWTRLTVEELQARKKAEGL